MYALILPPVEFPLDLLSSSCDAAVDLVSTRWGRRETQVPLASSPSRFVQKHSGGSFRDTRRQTRKKYLRGWHTP